MSNMLNTVCVVGKLKHYTSKRGTYPLGFIVENRGINGTSNIHVSVSNAAEAQKVIEAGHTCKMKIMGSLTGSCVSASHIDVL